MTAEEVSRMPTEHWLAHVLDVTAQIADRERQERRWLAPDPSTNRLLRLLMTP
jgi:hypothetical protein